jgi:hypothetical protein
MLVWIGISVSDLFGWETGLAQAVGGPIAYALTIWLRGHRLYWGVWVLVAVWSIGIFLTMAGQAMTVQLHLPQGPVWMDVLAPYVYGAVAPFILFMLRYALPEFWEEIVR